MNARRGLLRHAAQFGHRAVPFAGVLRQQLADRVQDDGFLVACRFVLDRPGIVFGRISLVYEQRRVAPVVDDQVRALAAGEAQRHSRAPPVVLERLALPCENGHAGLGDRGGRVVLRREDVAAAPANLGAQLDERLDQHGGLDRHVQRAHDPGPPERFFGAVFSAHGHQARHLLLGDLDFLAAPVRQRDVGYLVGQVLVDEHIRKFKECFVARPPSEVRVPAEAFARPLLVGFDLAGQLFGRSEAPFLAQKLQ